MPRTGHSDPLELLPHEVPFRRRGKGYLQVTGPRSQKSHEAVAGTQP